MNHRDDGKDDDIEQYSILFQSKELFENIINQEFSTFTTYKRTVRSKLIKENIKFSSLLKKQNFIRTHNSKNNKNSTCIIKNGIHVSEEMKGYKSYENIALGGSDIAFVPKGIFCYPIEDIIRADDLHNIEFIPNFSSREKFEKVIENTKFYLEEWFYEVPHNMDNKEKINNPEFMVWVLLKGLLEILSKIGKISQENLIHVLSIFSSLIDKNLSTVFKFYQLYLKKIFLEKEKNTNITLNNPLIMLAAENKNLENFEQISDSSNKSFEEKNINQIMNLRNSMDFENTHINDATDNRYNLQMMLENYISNYQDQNIKEKSSLENKKNPYYRKNETDDEMIYFEDAHSKENKRTENDCNSNQNERKKIEIFRKAYCQICYVYYCAYHYMKQYEFYNYDSCKISLHKKILKKTIKDITPQTGLKNINFSDVFKNPEENTNAVKDEFIEKYIDDNKTKKNINNKSSSFNYKAKSTNQNYKLNVNEYNPCGHHKGECNSDNCKCIKNRSACEKFCPCFGKCKYSYLGCKCKDSCGYMCSCALNMRECDPDICACCPNKNLVLLNNKNPFNLNTRSKIKSTDNIKISNEMNINITKPKELLFDCGNSCIFMENKKKTKISLSLITDGYGLFAMEDIFKGQFICEYKGELLTREETDRRSVFNDQIGLNYFFKLSDLSDIDAYRVGNEMR